MKTHLTRTLLALLAGSSLAFAQNRVIPSDPGADTGNTGAAGAGTVLNTRNPAPADSGYNRNSSTSPDSTFGANDRPGVTRGDTTEVPREHRRFFDKLSRLNEQELELSRLAAQSAATPQVRDFAQDMVKEHSKAGEEVTHLATQRGAMLKPFDARRVRDTEKDWADKKGRNYDKAYLGEVIDLHEDTVDVLEDGAKSKDAEIAALSNKMLPKVRAHLERARALHKAID